LVKSRPLQAHVMPVVLLLKNRILFLKVKEGSGRNRYR